MKLQNLFMIVLIGLIMFNCSSDDDNPPAETAIEGTWRLTAFTSANAHDLNGDGTASNSIMDETNCYQNNTVVFNAGGTGVTTSTSYADVYVELVTGTTDEYDTIIECVQENESTSFTWTQSGNSVIIEGDALTLSGNQLTLVTPSGFEFEDEQNGAIVIVEEDITLVFTKQ